MPLKNGKKIKSGRPSKLINREFLLSVRDGLIAGKSMREISRDLKVPYDTMTQWVRRNYLGFADKVLAYKHEKRFAKAEENLDQFLEMPTQNIFITKKGEPIEFDDVKKMKIKSDVTLFTLETLGKKHYSKRHEITGEDGEPLLPDEEKKRLDHMMKSAGGSPDKKKKR